MEKSAHRNRRHPQKDPDGMVQALFGTQQWAEKMIVVVTAFEEKYPMLLPVILHKRSSMSTENVSEEPHRPSILQSAELASKMVDVVLDFEDEFPGLLHVLLKRPKIPSPNDCSQTSWLNPPEMATKIVDIVLDFEDKFPGLLQVLRNKTDAAPMHVIKEDTASISSVPTLDAAAIASSTTPAAVTASATTAAISVPTLQAQRMSPTKQRKRF